MFKLLAEFFHDIIHNHVCLDYVFLQKNMKLFSFNQGFAYTSYNEINGIVIPEVLMSIVSVHVFAK